MLQTLLHFRTILTGQEVVIHTDHLNNTVMGANLTSPDKILRMLLEVEAMVRPTWVFAPGNVQFGDGLSRNSEERDEVRDQVETKSELPKTWAEAFAIATGANLDGQRELIDNADQYTQTFDNHLKTSQRTTNIVDPKEALDDFSDFFRHDLPRPVEMTPSKTHSIRVNSW